MGIILYVLCGRTSVSISHVYIHLTRSSPSAPSFSGTRVASRVLLGCQHTICNMFIDSKASKNDSVTNTSKDQLLASQA